MNWDSLLKLLKCPPKAGADTCTADLAACNKQVTGLKESLAGATVALALATENVKVCHEEAGTRLLAIIEERDTLLAKLQSGQVLFPPGIKFEPYGHMNETNIAWCKRSIENTGMSGIMVLGGIKEIRGVDDVSAHVPNCPANAIASVINAGTPQAPNMIIYVLPQGFMPGWDFPGTVIHEAVHGWQMLTGCTAGGIELSAYMVQQVFEWRYCAMNGKTARNLFRERPGAIGLL